MNNHQYDQTLKAYQSITNTKQKLQLTTKMLIVGLAIIAIFVKFLQPQALLGYSMISIVLVLMMYCISDVIIDPLAATKHELTQKYTKTELQQFSHDYVQEQNATFKQLKTINDHMTDAQIQQINLENQSIQQHNTHVQNNIDTMHVLMQSIDNRIK